jgi:hypothetical protein
MRRIYDIRFTIDAVQGDLRGEQKIKIKKRGGFSG